MLFPFIFSYAEIHYNLKYFYPKYYLKLPEILFDLPKRIIKNSNNEIPLLLIIKDADLFPITIKNIEINIFNKKKTEKIYLDFSEKISTKYFSKIFQISVPLNFIDTFLKVNVNFTVWSKGKKRVFINDNYIGLEENPFTFFYSKRKLPFPKNWFAGEPHYHSNYTSDQVEFGADIHSTKVLAKAMGLSWFFVTDHSYDLDDYENDYLKNDPRLRKWEKMKQDCKNEDSNELRVLFGEEVSIGNKKNRNVHLLAIQNKKFIQGKGDGAEIWFRNKPDRKIKEIPKLISKKNLFIAAHPNEEVPFMQYLTLRRGNWSPEDYGNGEITHLQLINSDVKNDITKNIFYWKKLLLSGKKFYLIAGNDSHGNFNFMKQIKIPFKKLFISKKQIFGNFMTVFKYHKNKPINGLKNGCIIVSNGPFINFSLMASNKEFYIGDSIKEGVYIINIEKKTSLEFGEIRSVTLLHGDLEQNKEDKIYLKTGDKIKVKKKSYLRMELITTNGLAFTNPIWIGY